MRSRQSQGSGCCPEAFSTMKPGKAVRGQLARAVMWSQRNMPSPPLYAKSKKSLHAGKARPTPDPSPGCCLFPPSRMQLHPLKPHGTEGIAKRTPDPLNIKNSKKPPLGAFYKGNFLQFFACFSPCARIMRLRRKQTMTFWWVNYDVLVGNYDILVGLCGVLCFFNYDVTQSFVIILYLCTPETPK